MKIARALLIFSYGLFTIAAQTLLFREFITTFEGNDISVGIFFASWFLWVGLGAVLVYKGKHFADWLIKNIELLFLSYLPAFVLQLVLIIQVREIAGVEPYTLLSIRHVIFWSIVVNAPVSVITGMLFPTACRWVNLEKDSSIRHVYIFEAAGSFVGGLGVTLLFTMGASLVKVFLILTVIICFSALIVQLTKLFTGQAEHTKLKVPAGRVAYYAITVGFCLLILLGVTVGLAGKTDEALMRYVRTIKWSKLLPPEALHGSFQTPQAEYLYGVYQGQWVVVSQGSVCEALPDRSTASQIAALSLCQNPSAEHILVIGSGLGLCNELLRLPQIKTVDWAHTDTEYVRCVNEFIPEEFRINDRRFQPLSEDVRSSLVWKKQYYDIVIVNLGEATSSVLNRYYTVEFYRQVKESLKATGGLATGMLAVSVAGGENIMGTELVNLGASTKRTLEQVFSNLVLVPGEDTWFVVSDSESISGDPAILRERFASIEGAGEIFSADGLLSVYLPDRAEKAMESYASADLPQRLMINRDSRPLTHLYSLLLAAKQSGAPLTRFVKLLAVAGPLVFVIPILVFVVLRIVYICYSANTQGRESGFDSSFLVFSTGWVAIGFVIVLMYLYQTRFGSLYLHIGIISSLFMVGLTAGATLISYLLRKHVRTGSWTGSAKLLLGIILVHTLILVVVAFWAAQELPTTRGAIGNTWQRGHLIFGLAFVLCGMCSGCYFPIAARQLTDAGFELGQAGSKLEMADHLGAAVGGFVTSLALVPILGTRLTLFLIVVIILANAPPAALKFYRQIRVYSPVAGRMAFRRRLGYTLAAAGVIIVLDSNLLAWAGARLCPSLPVQAAQALVGQQQLKQNSAILAESGRKINYFEVYDVAEESAGYVFSSVDLAPEVRGFGGKMNIAIYIDQNGTLIDFHVLRSNETPSYLDLLKNWLERLKGHKIFTAQPFAGVDTVTGATVSSKAIVSALEQSGHNFVMHVLGRSVAEDLRLAGNKTIYLPDVSGMYLVAALVLALFVSYYGGFWSRLAVLFINLLVGGIILNFQYSSEQMITFLSFQVPAFQLAGPFLLIVGVPVVVLLFGNIYCGYICPFGALQEVLSYIVPKRLKRPAPQDQMQWGRFVKYVVLFVLLAAFFLVRNRTTLAADPLISIFGLQISQSGFHLAGAGFSVVMFIVVVTALLFSLFYTRWWCRYLCPAGAFLSLLNGIALFKKYLPAKKFSKCEFGLTARDNLDCIQCDRCRYEKRALTRRPALERSSATSVAVVPRFFIISVLVAGILISGISIRRFLQVVPTGSDYSAKFVSSGGQPRDVDLQQIRKLIEQNRLSDHEADYYKKAE